MSDSEVSEKMYSNNLLGFFFLRFGGLGCVRSLVSSVTSVSLTRITKSVNFDISSGCEHHFSLNLGSSILAYKKISRSLYFAIRLFSDCLSVDIICELNFTDKDSRDFLSPTIHGRTKLAVTTFSPYVKWSQYFNEILKNVSLICSQMNCV